MVALIVAGAFGLGVAHQNELVHEPLSGKPA
jgi:hypothetical protein